MTNDTTPATREAVDDDPPPDAAAVGGDTPEGDAMQRKALIVGIDHYEELPRLHGCVADAKEMDRLLRTHADGRPNYDCRLHCDTVDGTQPITRAALRRLLAGLFTGARGELLLYFAGHGALTPTGGYLCTVDAAADDLGVSMDEVLQLAGRCEASSVLLVLDCCHSGSLGNPGLLAAGGGGNALALLRENVTIMAASRDVQVAAESQGRGAFTRAVTDALSGGAADMLGLVTAPSIYAYAERRFGPWQQRPVYKSHATDVMVVRECAPAIERLKLVRLAELFEAADYLYPLDPAHEPEGPDGRTNGEVDEEKVEIARLFKAYRDAGLLRPTVPGEQLYWTARNRGTVQLTERGREYWWLVRNGKL